MLKTLKNNQKQFYGAKLRGKRWAFVPRADGERFGLAITVVGLPGKIEVPMEVCWSQDFDAITEYADELNEERQVA